MGVVAALLSILACGDDGGGSAQPTVTETGTETPSATAAPSPDIPVRTLTADWASDNARDLPTLIASSTHVFTGEVVELRDQRMEEVSPGRGQPIEVPVSTFAANVDTAYKGDFPEAPVLIEQIGGVIEEDGDPTLVLLEGDSPLEIGQTYLFFSIEKANGTLNTPPFGRFIVSGGAGLAALPDWTTSPVAQTLTTLTLPQAADAIDDALEGGR